MHVADDTSQSCRAYYNIFHAEVRAALWSQSVMHGTAFLHGFFSAIYDK